MYPIQFFTLFFHCGNEDFIERSKWSFMTKLNFLKHFRLTKQIARLPAQGAAGSWSIGGRGQNRKKIQGRYNNIELKMKTKRETYKIFQVIRKVSRRETTCQEKWRACRLSVPKCHGSVPTCYGSIHKCYGSFLKCYSSGPKCFLFIYLLINWFVYYYDFDDFYMFSFSLFFSNYTCFILIFGIWRKWKK